MKKAVCFFDIGRTQKGYYGSEIAACRDLSVAHFNISPETPSIETIETKLDDGELDETIIEEQRRYERILEFKRKSDEELKIIGFDENAIGYFRNAIPIPPSREELELELTKYSPLFEVESLEGMIVLTRAPLGYAERVIKKVQELGGKNVVTLDQMAKIYRWPNFVSKRFTRRRMEITTLTDLKINYAQMRDRFVRDGLIFIKTIDKRYTGQAATMNEEHLKAVLDSNDPSLEFRVYHSNERTSFEVSPDELLIISEPLDLEYDRESKNVEYRFWVVNDRITGGYRHQGGESMEPPETIATFALNFIEDHKSVFGSYTLDIGLCKDGAPVVIELNTLSESGGSNVDSLVDWRDAFKKILEVPWGN